MLCTYSYLTNDKRNIGEFQVDVEDFKEFWRKTRNEIRACVVKLQDGQWWIMYRAYGDKPKWQKVKHGKNDVYQTVLKF